MSGLERLFHSSEAIGKALERTAIERGLRLHIAIAGSQVAAMMLAHAHPGMTVIDRAASAEALAPLPLGVLGESGVASLLALPTLSPGPPGPPRAVARGPQSAEVDVDLTLQTFARWGLKTLGDFARLPPADLAARLGRTALAWHAMARGEDPRPLIPTLAEERFDASLDLEWPIDGLEPLSFVLTRLLEPLSMRLEKRDRGAAVLHVLLRLVTRETYARRLELPSPMRDVRALRTLATLDLESHPPDAAIDRVTIVIDPTPGRVLQHTLFTRAHPTPEQMSTLLARLGAVMGQDRIGAPATVDAFLPGAFAMTPFNPSACGSSASEGEREASGGGAPRAVIKACGPSASEGERQFLTALRRCRHPVPARVTVVGDQLVRVTTDRRGFAGGTVVQCAGPWRTSCDWWASSRPESPHNRDEWDVALNDGAVYRIFRDRERGGWFIDGVID